jgi:hypothetical protein
VLSGAHRVKIFEKFFRLPWNVIDNKGPNLRIMGRMRLPWNVAENKGLLSFYPGML